MAEDVIGTTLAVRVMEATPETGRLVLSNRRAVEAESRKAHAIGDVLVGSVQSIQPYGAFVDLEGGGSGLLHISEVSSSSVQTLDGVLAIGNRVKVMVINSQGDKLSLSTRKLESTPGEMLKNPQARRMVVVGIDGSTSQIICIFLTFLLSFPISPSPQNVFDRAEQTAAEWKARMALLVEQAGEGGLEGAAPGGRSGGGARSGAGAPPQRPAPYPPRAPGAPSRVTVRKTGDGAAPAGPPARLVPAGGPPPRPRPAAPPAAGAAKPAAAAAKPAAAAAKPAGAKPAAPKK